MNSSGIARNARVAPLLFTCLAFLALSLPAGATGWTWMNPVPFGVPLTTVSQSASGEVLASGPDSTFLRRTATGWETLPSEVSVMTRASVTSPDGETFAVGGMPGTSLGGIVRWSGRYWAKFAVSAFSLSSIWAVSAREVWAGGRDVAGLGGAWIGVFNGAGHTATCLDESGDMGVIGIWASSSSDVWALVHSADGGAVGLYRFDGTTWSAEDIKEVSKGFNPSFLWGSGAGKPILVGNGKAGVTVAEKGSAGWSVTKTVSGVNVIGVSGTPDGTLGIACTTSGDRNASRKIRLM